MICCSLARHEVKLFTLQGLSCVLQNDRRTHLMHMQMDMMRMMRFCMGLMVQSVSVPSYVFARSLLSIMFRVNAPVEEFDVCENIAKHPP